jgi:nucleoside-diphosphate-sugar epimerase
LNILITGGAGYVGSLVIPELINNGYKVKCLDRFFFGDEFLSQDQFSEKLEMLHDDIRWFDSKLLDGVDIVLDLAAISNDPAGDLNPGKTFEINHMGRVRVAKLSKEHGVKRYILASSASIYGQQDQLADEKSSVNPLTAYSKANRNAEIDTLQLNDDNFTVTILRFSSVYGKSPRMRFDTAVNCMVLDLFKNNKIFVRGKSNKRPFIHIKDVVRAYILAIAAKKDKIGGQIFNVGSEDQNYEMGDLANEIRKICRTKCEIESSDTNDNRSYFASFKKIQDVLGFDTNYKIADGVKEMYESLKTGELTDAVKTRTVEWYKKLLTDEDLAKKFLINGTVL